MVGSRFIGQVMTGESDLRRIEDIDGAALTYAEVNAIASGNPLVIEKARVDRPESTTFTPKLEMKNGKKRAPPRS